MKTKEIKARNPSQVAANASGDRPSIPKARDRYGLTDEQKSRLIDGKGESAHTPTAHEISGGVIAGAIGYAKLAKVLEAAERDKLIKQRDELLAACKAQQIELKMLMGGEGCDHSVGICYCETFRVMEEAASVLKHVEEDK